MRAQRMTPLAKYVTSTLTILTILCQFPGAESTFDPEDLAGLYRLKSGVPTCSDLLRFTQSGLNIPSQAIEQDNESCQGGSLNLYQNPADGHGLLHFLSQYRGLTGDFYSGRLTSSLRCAGQVDIPQQVIFVFFTAEHDFQFTLRHILGVNSGIEMATGSPIMQFRRGGTYVFVGTTCVYEKDVSDVNLVPGAEQTDTADLRACFPSSARVRTRRGEIFMSGLRTGEVVQTGVGKWGSVVGWTHRDAGARRGDFVGLVTRGGQVLITTSGHYVYVNGSVMSSERVHVGDVLWPAGEEVREGDDDATVVSVRKDVWDIGLYNPQTTDGNIVVNGFVVTTYTTAVPPVFAHALLTPIRAMAGVCFPAVRGLSAGLLERVGELRSVLRYNRAIRS